MPIYEYECDKCGACFEEIVRLSDTGNPACAKCGSLDTRRVLSVCQSKSGSDPGFSPPASSCGSSGFS